MREGGKRNETQYIDVMSNGYISCAEGWINDEYMWSGVTSMEGIFVFVVDTKLNYIFEGFRSDGFLSFIFIKLRDYFLS